MHGEYVLDDVLLVKEPLALGEEVAQPIEAPSAEPPKPRLEVLGENCVHELLGAWMALEHRQVLSK